MPETTTWKSARSWLLPLFITAGIALAVVIEISPPFRSTEVDLGSGRQRRTWRWLGWTVSSVIEENSFSTAVAQRGPEQWLFMHGVGRGVLGRTYADGQAGRLGAGLYEVGNVFEVLEVPAEDRREIAGRILARVRPGMYLDVDWTDQSMKVTLNGDVIESWPRQR